MEDEYCNCSTGQAYYRSVVLGDTLIWVHVECSKPSWHTWIDENRPCRECGQSFSSPSEDICLECWKDPLVEDKGTTYMTWQKIIV